MINLRYSYTADDITKWKQYFASIRRPSLLHSHDYALSLGIYMRQKSYQIFIEIDGKIVGILQLIEVGLFKNLIHAVIVDRGPLWLEGYGSAAHQAQFWQTLDAKYPARFGRRRRFIPESSDHRVLENTGLRQRQNIKPYETIWLDLTPDLEVLRSGLKKNWRGALKKAEKSGLEIEWDESGQYFSHFLSGYIADKTRRGFSGPSAGLLKAMRQSFGASKNMLIARAKLDNEVAAAILILCHGRGATYQAGWTSDKGREFNAHHLLLWDALRVLKDKQVDDLDLGGINDETASGIKKFKEGMGGETAAFIGTYY